MGKLIDLTNQRFGFWLVLRYADKNKHGQTQWLCRCDCGTEKTITSNSLRIGNSTSCGCNHVPNLLGSKFGNLTVIKLEGNKNRRHWLCQCLCGETIVASTYQLRQQKITDCGCDKVLVVEKITEKIVPSITTINVLRSQNLDILKQNISIIKQQTEWISKCNEELRENLKLLSEMRENATR